QEMTVISGAFNAEYGKAMSGIVNLVTKEGGDTYSGSFSAYGGDYLTTHEDVFFAPSGVQLNAYTLEGSLGGPVPGLRWARFYASGRHDQSDGSIFGIRQHLPSDSANFNVNPWYYEIYGEPWWRYEEGPVTLPDGSVVQGDSLPLPDEVVPM